MNTTPSAPAPLTPAQLCHRVDTADWSFDSSIELEALNEIVGQERALDAVRFGVGIRHDGYNLFVLGPASTGSRNVVRMLLEQQASTAERPADWCYVNNFAAPHQPKLLRLPAGEGAALRYAIDALIQDMLSAIPGVFESEDYRSRRHQLEQAFKDQNEQAMADIEQEAEANDIALMRTSTGIVFSPRMGEDVMTNEDFDKLPQDQQDRINTSIASLHERTVQLFNQIPQWRRELQQRIRELNQQAIMAAVGHFLHALKQRYADLPDVVNYLNRLEQAIVENAFDFVPSADSNDNESPGASIPRIDDMPELRPYRVNLIVDNSDTQGAPVVYADNPSFGELLGRAEYVNQLGTLITNFTLIKGGALHRANGGYLILDARQLLTQPFAWEGIKRCLFSGTIRIESPGQMLSLVSTVSLDPEPVPLNVKIVLVGERFLYYLLYHYDADFRELFRVAADFDDDMPRTPENLLLHARLMATLAHKNDLLPLQKKAIARLLEQSSRLAGDSEKLSVWIHDLADLLREADYLARQSAHPQILADDIQAAIDGRIRRSDRMRISYLESIRRGTIMIDTQGSRVGQVNGLTVVSLGGFDFGFPTRITATARLGSGKVVDIQREVALSGPIHSKGVLILSSFLGARYCPEQPLSLSAALVFEQTYGAVDGDSASCAELCALLSALAEVPIKQNIAITGSVNQHGEVQAIGGVNEKIEGFFQVCKERGLSGDQAVLIPASNIPHLMLRDDVVEACAQQQFHVYPIRTVDEALALLTGIPAGSRSDSGEYPADSINGKVEQRLTRLAEKARALKAGKDDTATAGSNHNGSTEK
ncbi:MAG: ATP-binding protein [Gammaproteobacteria bacterium]